MAPAKKEPATKTTPTPAASQPAAAAEAPAPQGKKTNVLAIVAIVFAFLFPVVGLILGIVALSQIKKRNEGGHGVAVASIVIAIVLMIVEFLAVLAFWGLVFSVNKQLKDNGVDINNGSINAKDDKGNSISIGNAKLPDGFPSDVPVYTPSKITGSSKYGTNKYTVVLTTSDSASKVQDYYKSQLAANGWSSDNGTGSINFQSGTVATFNKGSNQLLVTISSDNKGGDDNTLITLTVAPKTSTE